VWTFAALLLIIGYIRKSRSARRRLAIWEAEERERDKRRELAMILGHPGVSSPTPGIH
jgi:hypothetical protein